MTAARSRLRPSPRRRLRWLPVVVLLLVGPLLCTHCILAVSDLPDPGPHCTFAGTSSQCGACIKAHCQDAVDACCGAMSCAPVLSKLESCTTRHDASCNIFGSRPPTSPSQGVALAQCVHSACSAACATLGGVSQTACHEQLLGEGTTCSCQVDPANANDFICSEGTYPRTLCCAPAGWPAPGLECACRPLGCDPTSDGCYCDLVDYGPTERKCAGQTCCADQDSCTCRAGSCFSFETQVPACDIQAVTCAQGQHRVASCSVRN